MSLKKVLHVDDHAVVTVGLEQLLRMIEPEIEFRSATTLEAAFVLMKAFTPDLVFLDLQLADDTALDHIEAIKAAANGAPVAVYSAIDDLNAMLIATRRGADGYIRKNLPMQQQRDAIAKLLANGYYLPPELANAERKPLMNERRLEVLRLVVRGKSNKQIAKLLAIEPDTVKTHLQNIFRALGVHNRTEAAREARARGLVQ